MPNAWFQFKQFMVKQDRCAMKVGTDGVLLGAWCSVDNCARILDIGTGTGLIALMCAQRSDAEITAIEIDQAAAGQASENFRSSKWSDRITIFNEDFRNSKSLEGAEFDLIVCNPPFFRESVRSPREARNTARHEINLNLGDLFKGCPGLLTSEGRISIIIPDYRFHEASKIADSYGLNLLRKTTVYSRMGEKPLRILAEWSVREIITEENSLIIYQDKSSGYHADFINLTQEFYLDRN